MPSPTVQRALVAITRGGLTLALALEGVAAVTSAQLLAPPRGSFGPDTGSATDGGPGDRSAAASGRFEPWRRWWTFNQDPHLARSRSPESLPVGATPLGADAPDPSPRRPPPAVTYGEVYPAILGALGSSRDVDIRAAALLALAKIGPPPQAIARTLEVRPLTEVLEESLSDANERVRDLGILALGISGVAGHAPLLAAIAADEPAGRAAIRGGRIDVRSRAFAAHGLGLLGARTHRVAERALVEHHLRRLALKEAEQADLLSAAVLGLGWCPLPFAPPGEQGGRELTVRTLLGILEGRRTDPLGRAQIPVAIARLLVAPLEGTDAADMEAAGETRRALRLEVVRTFAAGLAGGTREKSAVVREGLAQALGLLVMDTSSAPDLAAQAALRSVAERGQEAEALCALIALGRIAGRASTDSGQTLRTTRAFIRGLAAEGSTTRQASALLALGVTEDRALSAGHAPALGTRAFLAERSASGSPSQRTAAAVALGLGGPGAAPAGVRDGLQRGAFSDRGACAVAVAMLGDERGLAVIRAELREPLHRPYLTRDFATALALVADPELVPLLVDRLVLATFVPERLAAIKAFEWALDPSAADALLFVVEERRLGRRKIDDTSRALAISALGNLCSRRALPWNAPLALDVVWNAAPPSLTDARNGGGVLDVL